MGRSTGRLGLLFLLGLGAGCVVDRSPALSEFACQAGGPCARQDAGTPDQGIAPPFDAGDAGPRPDLGPGRDLGPDLGGPDLGEPRDMGAPIPDFGPYDGGSLPLPVCPGIVELSASGVEQGSTEGEQNGLQGSCFDQFGQQNAPDKVFGFSTTIPLKLLEISLAGSDYDTAAYVYQGDCVRSNEIACNLGHSDVDIVVNERVVGISLIRLTDVQPGSYAIVVDGVVDGAGGSGSGNYVLRAEGTIAAGGVCDPNKSYLKCEHGTCNFGNDGVPRCSVPIDCQPGIDADGDGNVGVDPACNGAANLTCSAVGTPMIGLSSNFQSLESNGVSPISEQWTVVEAPVGSYAGPVPRRAANTGFVTDLMGNYTLRYTLTDAQNQLAACEASFAPGRRERFRLEAIWDPQLELHELNSRLDLTLINPDANTWLQDGRSCEAVFGCTDFEGDFMDWGMQGLVDDDPFLVRSPLASPQAIVVPNPQQNEDYRVGLGFFAGSAPPQNVSVRIWCDGMLAGELPVTGLMEGSEPIYLDNDFAKVARVRFDGNGCQVTPLGQVVTYDQAGTQL